MLGDRSWHELLFARYEQYVADSARRDKVPVSFDTWAIERTWQDFVTLARLVLALPEFALSDWETANPIPGGSGRFHSTVLARRLLNALVLVNQLLRDMKGQDRLLALMTRRYLKEGGRLNRRDEAAGFVFGWLKAAAQRQLAYAGSGSV